MVDERQKLRKSNEAIFWIGLASGVTCGVALIGRALGLQAELTPDAKAPFPLLCLLTIPLILILLVRIAGRSPVRDSWALHVLLLLVIMSFHLLLVGVGSYNYGRALAWSRDARARAIHHVRTTPYTPTQARPTPAP